MHSFFQTGGSLLRAATLTLSRLLSFPGRSRHSASWKRPPKQTSAPACLKRTFHEGEQLLVNPVTEERCSSGLTKAEAEELLDWIEVNGFHLHGVSFRERTDFVVHWDVG